MDDADWDWVTRSHDGTEMIGRRGSELVMVVGGRNRDDSWERVSVFQRMLEATGETWSDIEMRESYREVPDPSNPDIIVSMVFLTWRAEVTGGDG